MEKVAFDTLRKIIFDYSGISLSEDKVPLLTTRLNKRLRTLNLSDEIAYLNYLEQDASGHEIVNLIDVVSTNTTYFYREPEHFDFLKEALKKLVITNKKEIKIWCAAASSGEEPYCLSITARDCLGAHPFRILATDISTTILKRAISGIYSLQQLGHISEEIQRKHLNMEIYEGETYFSVKPEIKAPILFKRLNLSSFPYPLKGPFDFIFCRNVMIYFDNNLKTRMIQEFERLLAPDGYLVISKTESLVSIPNRLTNLGNSIYRQAKKVG